MMITIALVVLGTVLTRFLPGVLFPPTKPMPPVVAFLGQTLPIALMGMLVVFSLKDTNLSAYPHGLPVFIAVIITALLHAWKSKALLSVIGGTVSYMILIQLVFVP